MNLRHLTLTALTATTLALTAAPAAAANYTTPNEPLVSGDTRTGRLIATATTRAAHPGCTLRRTEVRLQRLLVARGSAWDAKPSYSWVTEPYGYGRPVGITQGRSTAMWVQPASKGRFRVLARAVEDCGRTAAGTIRVRAGRWVQSRAVNFDYNANGVWRTHSGSW